MDLNEMRRRYREQKAQCQRIKESNVDSSPRVADIANRFEPVIVSNKPSSVVQDTEQTLRFADGAFYIGNLDENGSFSGHGVYTFPDGSIYDGLWDKGERDGEGTLTWKNGSKFVGNWVRGKRHGHGRHYDSNGHIVLEGEWLDGEYVELSNTNVHNNTTNSNWKDATSKAINLLYRLEDCNTFERRDSLALIESIKVSDNYDAAWNLILSIWKSYSINLSLNTKTIPNPSGIRFTQRPFPITSSSIVQDVIKEIISNT